MKEKGFTSLYILLGTLVIAVAIVAGAYLVKQTVNFQPKATSPVAQPTPTTKPQVSVTPVSTGLLPQITNNNEELAPDKAKQILPLEDETVNWKTYINSKFSYSFKYPSNWWINKTGIKNMGTANEFNIYNFDLYKMRQTTPEGEDAKGVPPEGALVVMGVIVDENYSSAEEVFKEMRINYATNYTKSQPINIFNKQEIIVDSQKGIFYEVDRPGLESNAEVSAGATIIEFPKKNATIALHYSKGPNLAHSKLIYNAILSTFKFTQ